MTGAAASEALMTAYNLKNMKIYTLVTQQSFLCYFCVGKLSEAGFNQGHKEGKLPISNNKRSLRGKSML